MAFGLGVRLPGLAIAAHGRTATCLPARPVVDSLCRGKATVVETCHRHVFFTGSSLSGSNPLQHIRTTFSQKTKTASQPGYRSCGALQGIRTPDLLVRSQTLYPTELAAHTTPLLECIIYVIIVEHGCQPFFSSRIIFFAFSSNSLSAA